MPAMQTETVFLPYLNGGEGLAMALVGARVDGRAVQVPSDPEAALVDLFAVGSGWQEIALDFDVQLATAGPSIGEMVPARERTQPAIQLFGCLHASTTYRRWAVKGPWDVDAASGRVVAAIRRQDVAGTVELQALLTRTTTQREDPSVASEKGARLAWSRQWRIYVDQPEHRAGPGIKTTWEEFKTSPSRWRKLHPELLFHLDMTAAVPILFLNSGIDPDLQAVLKDEAPRGKKAAARDIVFAAMAISVWSSLLAEAHRALPTEGLPDPGWHRKVLERIAEVLYPAHSKEEGLETMIGELRDENGGAGIRERIASVILELSSVRGFAETLVRELA